MLKSEDAITFPTIKKNQGPQDLKLPVGSLEHELLSLAIDAQTASLNANNPVHVIIDDAVVKFYNEHWLFAFEAVNDTI